MFRAHENAGGVVDANGVVGRGMHDQQRLAQIMDIVEQALLCDVVEELALDGEGAAREGYLRLAVLANAVDMVLEEPGDMDGVRRRGDGDDGLCFRNFAGGGEDGGTAEAVADQDRGCFTR